MSINLSENPRGGTMCLTKAGLAEGTNANTFKIAAPNGAGVDYVIDGVFYHYADADNLAMTAAAVQADLTTCIYLVVADTNSAVTTIKGTAVSNAAIDAGEALYFPPVPAGQCPIGAIVVKNNGGTFTAASTDLGAATVTDTYYDLMCLPTQPLNL